MGMDETYEIVITLFHVIFLLQIRILLIFLEEVSQSLLIFLQFYFGYFFFKTHSSRYFYNSEKLRQSEETREELSVRFELTS